MSFASYEELFAEMLFQAKRHVHTDYLQGEIIEFWWTSADDYMQLIVIFVRNIFFFPVK